MLKMLDRESPRGSDTKLKCRNRNGETRRSNKNETRTNFIKFLEPQLERQRSQREKKRAKRTESKRKQSEKIQSERSTYRVNRPTTRVSRVLSRSLLVWIEKGAQGLTGVGVLLEELSQNALKWKP